jgi:exonuclease III
MKILFWNIKGVGGASRRKQLRELMQEHTIDVLCLLETIKADFSLSELRSLEEGGRFSWNWTEARGHLGGTLLGVKQGEI